jgi:hypothetical protein
VSNLLFQIFSHELAQGLNRFTVQVYEIFPTLKKKCFFRIGLARSAITRARFISQGNRRSHGHCRRCFYRHGSAAPKLDGTVC